MKLAFYEKIRVKNPRTMVSEAGSAEMSEINN